MFVPDASVHGIVHSCLQLLHQCPPEPCWRNGPTQQSGGAAVRARGSGQVDQEQAWLTSQRRPIRWVGTLQKAERVSQRLSGQTPHGKTYF